MQEINILELEFLDILDFNLSVTSDEYEIYFNELQSYFNNDNKDEKEIDDVIF